jgi:hypothetical protein
MPDVRAIAAAYGVRVELADLGDWASVTLVAEYDPDGPVIRVNERALPHVTLSLSKGAPPRYAIDHAIAHELYHHREAIGEIARIAGRAARERAADAYADELVRAR